MAFIERNPRADEPLDSRGWEDDDTTSRQNTSNSRPIGGPGLEASPIQRRQRPWPAEQRAVSASRVPAGSASDLSTAQATFESPLRSIIVSGVPTASVSANTALASLSSATPSSSSAPAFVALTNAGARRVLARSESGMASSATPPSTLYSTLYAKSFPTLQKDLDDPHAAPSNSGPESYQVYAPVAVSRQLPVSHETSPAVLPRSPSYLGALPGPATSTLTGHLFHHGFLEGIHSDITIVAFGQRYRLHKLLLHRVPFFASAFSGPWAESSAKEMVLYPEEIDSNINQAAFELAIKRIYGTQFPQLEEEEAVGLFAAASWLDMPEIIESSVDSILRQMEISTLHQLIRLVTTNNYGKPGDRILASVKAVLCREGWEMPLSLWDDIPSEVIREVVGADPFFVPSEWERWLLATKILNRKLKVKAIEAGLISKEGTFLCPRPFSHRSFAIRFDTASRQHAHPKDGPWISLYASPEVAPLLVLLDEGVHYVHLSFEQLQQIRAQRDVLGVPVLPEQLISDALWMSMELRQRILNADENDLELGLAETAQEADLPGVTSSEASPHRDIKGKQRALTPEPSPSVDDRLPTSHAGTIETRKFWIPTSDMSCVIGGTREANELANATASNSDLNDLPWASDFVLDSRRPLLARNVDGGGGGGGGGSNSGDTPRQYSRFPPFRFAAEFPHPATLKDKKRVYSGTVWYAGSLWKLYVQRVHSSKSHQLGIYLHRAKDAADEPLGQVLPVRSVDDRIGQFEREMHMRRAEGRPLHIWRGEDEPSNNNNSSISSHAARPVIAPLLYRPPWMMEGDSNNMAVKDEGPERSHGSPNRQQQHQQNTTNGSNWTEAELLLQDEDLVPSANTRQWTVPAVPPYFDNRPVIKSYFKIYSTDKAGRLLNVYESAPEKFVVNKSWGWKSSSFAFDDTTSSSQQQQQQQQQQHQHQQQHMDYDMTARTATTTTTATTMGKDGRMRFMCLIGNM